MQLVASGRELQNWVVDKMYEDKELFGLMLKAYDWKPLTFCRVLLDKPRHPKLLKPEAMQILSKYLQADIDQLTKDAA